MKNITDNSGQSPQEYYLEIRDKIEDLAFKEGSKLDSAILLLTTGSIVISMNFANSLNDMIGHKILILSWTILITSLILHLLSYIFFSKRCDSIINNLDKWKEKGFKTSFDPNDKHRKIIANCNIWSYILLILGIISLTDFVYINILIK